jgi:hypothetical protein
MLSSQRLLYTHYGPKGNMPILSEPTLLAGRISFLFGILQPIIVYRATIVFVTKVKYSRSPLYDKVCAILLHRFIIAFLCLVTFKNLRTVLFSDRNIHRVSF